MNRVWQLLGDVICDVWWRASGIADRIDTALADALNPKDEQ